MEEGAVLALMKGAKSMGQAVKYLNRYASENDVTREQAAKMLFAEARRKGDKAMQNFLEDYQKHEQWRRKHAVAGTAARTVDPLGVLGVYGRRTRKWWKSKP